jgi:DUF4097 and DUF4098 domain-containing protein YvlB
MTTIILAGLLAFAPPLQQQLDTTISVRPGGQLHVEAMIGRATVQTWDRNAVRVRATPENDAHVTVRETAQGVSVGTRPGRGGPARVTYELTVPRGYAVALEGLNLRVDVEGVQGDVSVENIEGTIALRGVGGAVRLESVSGGMVLEDITGSVTANSINQNIRLARVRGDVSIEAVNGSIVMREMNSARVRAATVNGLIEYDGPIQDGGRYALSTHNGRITMSVPEQANANISVTTRSGRVETGFPVPLSDTRGNRMSFRLGTGSADVDLQSFNGTIRLVRPGGR